MAILAIFLRSGRWFSPLESTNQQHGAQTVGNLRLTLGAHKRRDAGPRLGGPKERKAGK